MSDVDRVFESIRNHEVKYLDFRFTDPRGKWHHLTRPVAAVDEETFAEGIPFDGSSVVGWKAIHESDMMLLPDPASAVLDPFAAHTSLLILCDILEPVTGQPYARDPRSTAKRAEAYLNQSGIGDAALFAPDLEFFVFNEAHFEVSKGLSFFRLDAAEAGPSGAEGFEGEGVEGGAPRLTRRRPGRQPAAGGRFYRGRRR